MSKKYWESKMASKGKGKGVDAPEACIMSKAYSSLGLSRRGVSHEDFIQDPAAYLRRLSMGGLGESPQMPDKGSSQKEESRNDRNKQG